MARTISYADAVRILGGGPESAAFQRVNTLTGGLLAGAAVGVPGLLGLLDRRGELARVSGELVTSASRQLAGSAGRDRTDRLAAAHTVLVVAAYFDAIAGVDLGWARLSTEDQLRLAGHGVDGGRDLTSAALTTGLALPEPHVPHDRYLAYLDELYAGLSRKLGAFLAGLAPWDSLTEGDRGRFLRQIAGGGRRARDRYESMLLDLMADCPDLALWIDRRNQVSVEQRLDALEPSLRRLERLLNEVAAGAPADGVAAALRRAHAALLEHRIVESADLPDGLDVATLAGAYIPPAFQVAERGGGRSPADEAFWSDADVREDIDRFLAGFLGSPRALRAPLLVLGQPGAGKSVLTRILAGRLSGTRFLPIRVQLRDVDSSLMLQRQIEQAILAATTEEASWPELARSTGALPVVIFDGFDELLQATGVDQADFLQRVVDFQQREREQGRAAAVVVTSRISVADRATVPGETVLLRLRPFDERRIRTWVESWNEVNAAGLAGRGCEPLAVDSVLAHADLAGQPLLLLMLALYDSDGNALHSDRNAPRAGTAGRLTTGELYEQLLTAFARREVAKAYPKVSPKALEDLAEQELNRLAIVAFAMLNRSAQWVTEEAVGQDLRVTLGEPAPGRADALAPAELIFGRFFFVHRAQAVRGGVTRGTYEFLHATFGEYLVARLTWRLLAEAVARDSVTLAARPMTGNDLLADLLSWVSLTTRAPIVQFLAESAAGLRPDERERWADVLIRVFRQFEREGSWPASGYRAVPGRNVAARFAAYTANLTLLAVVTSGGLRFGELAEPAYYEPFRQWHDHTTLWHGQLGNEGWRSLVDAFAIERRIGPGGRDVHLTLDDGSFVAPKVDPLWVLRVPESERGNATFGESFDVEANRRRVLFQACDELVWHVVEPLLDSRLGPTMTYYASWWAERCPSAAQALLEVWLLPVSGAGPEEVAEAYRRCVQIAVDFPMDQDLQREYADQLLRTLAGHHAVPVPIAVEVLARLLTADEGTPDEWLRTATTILARAERGDAAAADLADAVLRVITHLWSAVRDRRVAIVAAAQAVPLLDRRRHRGTDVAGKLERRRGSVGADEIRGELETFRIQLDSLRTMTKRWRTDLDALFDEYSWLAAGSEDLRASLVALARLPEAVGDVEETLSFLDQRISTWVSDYP